MKKILLGTSAIAGLALIAAGAASAAEKPQLKLGGFFQEYGVYVNQDEGNATTPKPGYQKRQIDLKRDSEVFFEGESKMDNGLTVGAHIELKGQNGDPNGTIDETYLYFASQFGKVNVGATYGAPYLLQVTAPAADANIDGFDPQFNLINYATGVTSRIDSAMLISNKNEKLTYITPVMSGFQAGVSFSPANCKEGDGTCTGRLGGMVGDKTVGAINDVIEGGVKYAGEFSGVKIDVGAGYTFANLEANNTARTLDDRQAYQVGAVIGYGAFALGGDYLHDDNGNTAKKNSDYKAYRVGATYTTGCVTVGASYLANSREVGAGVKKDELKRIAFGGTYEFGPGLSFRGSIQHYDVDTATQANKNDAYGVVIGTVVNF